MNTLSASANTIADRPNPGYGQRKHTTYGRHDRLAKPIGTQRHAGQQAYMERYPNYTPAASASQSVMAASPVKRRKTEKSFNGPIETVEIPDSGDDEIEDHGSPLRQVITPRACSAISPGRPHSTSGWQFGKGTKPASQRTSEFTKTSKLLNPKRTRPRRKPDVGDADQRESIFEVPVVAAGSLSGQYFKRSTPNHIQHAHMNNVEDLEQGMDRSSRRPDALHSADKVASKYFTRDQSSQIQMRINESTAEEVYQNIASHMPAIPNPDRELRQFRHAESHAPIEHDTVDGSEDELAQSDTGETRQKQSISKSTQKRSTNARSSLPPGYYRLRLFQTYGSRSGDDQSYLMLSQTQDRRFFRITAADVDGNEKPLHELDLRNVNRVLADDTRRMRLTGPKNSDGEDCWCDLEFEDTDTFLHFRNEVIFPECMSSSRIIKDS